MSESGSRTRAGVETLGPYRLLAPLGQGGMAAVHLAVKQGPSGFNKLVVIKQILPKFAGDDEMVSMFLDEARLAARLNHPNLVQTNEVAVIGRSHFLAMEYLDGQPLNRVLQRLSAHEGLPLATHLQIIADLLGGLHHAHELADFDGRPLGVVHCDVNPQNVFVTYDGVVKVIDFGVATARTALTKARPGIIKGKPAYMSPEQLSAQKLDRRADIFAVGVMLWEAATGTRPWRDVNPRVMVERVMAGQFPAPCVSNPAVSVELEAIILKALAFDPRSRYATAAELQAALEEHLATLGGRVAPHDIGQMIATHFAPERTVMNALIEDQLDAAAPGAPDSAAASIDVDTTAPSARTAMPAGLRPPSPPTIARPDLFDATTARDGAAPSPPLVTTTRQRPTREAPEVTLGSPGMSPRSAIASAMASSLVTKRRSNRVSPLVAIAVAVALGIVGFGSLSSGAGAVPAPVAGTELELAPSSTDEAPAAPPGVAETVELQLAATPSTARFFLDDVPLQGNPYRADLPRDCATHQFRVEAPGYISRTEAIRLDKNRVVDVVLAPETPQQRAVGGGRRGARGPRVKISEW